MYETQLSPLMETIYMYFYFHRSQYDPRDRMAPADSRQPYDMVGDNLPAHSRPSQDDRRSLENRTTDRYPSDSDLNRAARQDTDPYGRANQPDQRDMYGRPVYDPTRPQPDDRSRFDQPKEDERSSRSRFDQQKADDRPSRFDQPPSRPQTDGRPSRFDQTERQMPGERAPYDQMRYQPDDRSMYDPMRPDAERARYEQGLMNERPSLLGMSERPSLLGDRPVETGERSLLGDRPMEMGERSLLGDRPRETGERSLLGDRPRETGERSLLGDRPRETGERGIGADGMPNSRSLYDLPPQKDDMSPYSRQPPVSEDSRSYSDRPRFDDRSPYDRLQPMKDPDLC